MRGLVHWVCGIAWRYGIGLSGLAFEKDKSIGYAEKTTGFACVVWEWEIGGMAVNIHRNIV